MEKNIYEYQKKIIKNKIELQGSLFLTGRQQGKTTAIMELAIKYNRLVIVPNERMAYDLNRKSNRNNKKLYYSYFSPDILKGLFNKEYYIDELKLIDALTFIENNPNLIFKGGVAYSNIDIDIIKSYYPSDILYNHLKHAGREY